MATPKRTLRRGCRLPRRRGGRLGRAAEAGALRDALVKRIHAARPPVGCQHLITPQWCVHNPATPAVASRTENRYSTARSGLLNAARSARRHCSRSKPISIMFCMVASSAGPTTKSDVAPGVAGPGSAGAAAGTAAGSGAGAVGSAGAAVVGAGAVEAAAGAAGAGAGAGVAAGEATAATATGAEVCVPVDTPMSTAAQCFGPSASHDQNQRCVCQRERVPWRPSPRQSRPR